MSRKGITLFFCCLLLLYASRSSYSITIVVPDNFSRIGDALSTMTIGDTLVIQEGRYSPSTNNESFPLLLKKGIFLIGENRDFCIIDAEGTNRVFVCEDLTAPQSYIENITIRGGSSEYRGGGIAILNNTSITIRNCHITGNYSSNGGGGVAIVSSDEVLIENCVIDSNSGELRGGGIYCYESSPNLAFNLLSSNSSLRGGGIGCLNESSPMITENAFEYNSATSQGGGIEGNDNSSPVILGCTFSYNTAYKGGGCSFQDGSTARIEDGYFYQNKVRYGGAVFCSNTGATVFKRNVIDGNTAGGDGEGGGGGGIYLHSYSEALIDSNTIINNRAGDEEGSNGYGGGIMCNNGPSPTITNNIIHNNSSNDEGGGIWMNSGSSGVIENNDIQYNTTGYAPREGSGVGGGVFLFQADVIVRSNTISNNYSESRTGGIYVQNEYPCGNSDNVYPLIMYNMITDNVSNHDGGGITTSQCDSSSVVSNTISNNFAKHGGGAFQLSFNSRTYISENIIEGNQCEDGGGGALFICDGSKPTIHNNIISNNSANDKPGGAIDCLQQTAPVITDNLISDNWGRKGGGINVRDSAIVKIERNTFLNNSAEISGGALCSYGEPAALVISNNTFFGNDSGDGSTIVTGNETFSLIQNNIISIGSGEVPLNIANYNRLLMQNNCFWSTQGDTIKTGVHDSLDNFFADPQFVDPLGFDFQLSSSSPCIDAGNPESPLDPDGTIADVGRYFFEQGTGIIDPPEGLSGKLPLLSLFQNFPNPFNPTTTITVVVDSDYLQSVRIRIFNSRGRCVKQLFNGSLEEGVYRFIWDGSDNRSGLVGSGVYFCRVETGKSSSTIKMILAK